ncbi:MAG: hypothetical protein RL083_790 [Pseudomonadota bacterium]
MRWWPQQRNADGAAIIIVVFKKRDTLQLLTQPMQYQQVRKQSQ